MKRQSGVCSLIVDLSRLLVVLGITASAFGQARGAAPVPAPLPDNAASLVHVRAAHDIAGSDAFLGAPFNFFCIPGNPRANATNAPELDPIRVFDNVYAVGNSETTVYAITTTDGILLIDSGYADRVESVVVPGLQKLGLDPSKVRYILITHGHADHFGGAKYFEDHYGTQVGAAAADWDAISPPAAPGGSGAPSPGRVKRGIVLADGQPFVLGDLTITPIATPGHTPGSLALIFPVKDGGRTRMAGLFGGAMLTMNRVTADGLKQYLQSIDHYVDAAKKLNVEVELQNHGIFDGMPERLAALKSQTAGSLNPFFVGKDKYVKMWNIISECFQAELARRN